jgi:lipopolysaccharide export system protein LptA
VTLTSRPMRFFGALLIAATLGGTLLATAQPLRSRGARRQEPQKNQPFHFGDITISNYAEMKGTLGVVMEARGPNTTVEVLDPKQPKVKTRLHAAVMKAHFVQNSGNEVERIEATGSVRYLSSRPTGVGETQVLEGTASRAIYYKNQGRLVLEGPIGYTGRRSDKNGASIQSVKGTAGSASYDEEKQIVSLNGDVNATFTSPSLKTPATLTGASNITVDLSKQPLEYEMKGGKIQFEPKEGEKKNP